MPNFSRFTNPLNDEPGADYFDRRDAALEQKMDIERQDKPKKPFLTVTIIKPKEQNDD